MLILYQKKIVIKYDGVRGDYMVFVSKMYLILLKALILKETYILYRQVI
jgi:hypothetical protein